MRITFISDTHNIHDQVTKDLPGGDLIICAGDVTLDGYLQEMKNFCEWFDGLRNYDHKIWIGGNHEFCLQDFPSKASEYYTSYKDIHYLQDDWLYVGEEYEDLVKVYGSPWQVAFFNYAFNLPKGSEQLKEKWDAIPGDTDILVTHGPALGMQDFNPFSPEPRHIGCELLIERIKVVKPKIHVCGHIHPGYGHTFDGTTHFINASVVTNKYKYGHLPISVEWDKATNDMTILQMG